MSRSYRLNVEVKNKLVKEKDVRKIVSDKFGWAENDLGSFEKVIYFDGEGCLCGGLGEDEAHEQILKEFRKINPKINILTRWTYLEELPSTEYGKV